MNRGKRDGWGGGVQQSYIQFKRRACGQMSGLGEAGWTGLLDGLLGCQQVRCSMGV